ncbi:MAG: FAD binding domain-containing protein [Myxococcota bacterium]|jgi:xanthine dehydrogenase small subunit|nr:FAD binding domain-containing protein [Myxococcota bacterium]
MLSFMVNQRLIQTKEPPGMVLLEFVRDVLRLTGTKEACREGECGACTVLVGRPTEAGSVHYDACASCLVPIGDVEGCHVLTVEGLELDHAASAGRSESAVLKPLTLVQELIVDNSASQCGFCTPGIVLSLTGFALNCDGLSLDDAIDALDGNICRCTGYVAIRNAARALSERLAGLSGELNARLPALVEAGVLPRYLLNIPQQLAEAREQTGQVECVPTGKVVLVAGGTDLFVQKPAALLDAELCFLSHRRDLDFIKEEAGELCIGAAVTLERLRRDPLVAKHFPSFSHDLALHSSTILRNKATLSGNIVNASPIGDATIMLLALDAGLSLQAADGSVRQRKLREFFLAYKKTDLQEGEIITAMHLPLLAQGERFSFQKVSNRVTLDIAAVNTAMRLRVDDRGCLAELAISAGGVGPIPMMIKGLEPLAGRSIDALLVEEVAKIAFDAAKPIDDIRGSAAYKRGLLGQLVRAHFAGYLQAEVER